MMPVLNNPTRGDASVILAHQLVATVLNFAHGSDPQPILDTINQASELLTRFGGKLPFQVKPASTVGQAMVHLSDRLGDYNSGLLTPDCEQ